MKKKMGIILLVFIMLLILVGCNRQENKKIYVNKLDQGEYMKIESDQVEFDLEYYGSEDLENEELEKVIVEYLDYDINEMGMIRYLYNYIDLNDSYENLVFAYLLGDHVSGTGGGTGLIVDLESKSVLVEFVQVNNPIVISNEKTNGWNDIILPIPGELGKGYAKMTFDGEKYPMNPTILEEIREENIKGVAIIAGDIEIEDGFMLGE